jgi:hypothetical protein
MARRIQWRGILEPAFEPVADLDVAAATSDRSCRSYQECCRKEDTILSLMGRLTTSGLPSVARRRRAKDGRLVPNVHQGPVSGREQLLATSGAGSPNTSFVQAVPSVNVLKENKPFAP